MDTRPTTRWGLVTLTQSRATGPPDGCRIRARFMGQLRSLTLAPSWSSGSITIGTLITDGPVMEVRSAVSGLPRKSGVGAQVRVRRYVAPFSVLAAREVVGHLAKSIGCVNQFGQHVQGGEEVFAAAPGVAEGDPVPARPPGVMAG